MQIPVFWGCQILTNQFAYEMSVRETFPELDIGLLDLPESNCCGDPVKSMNISAGNYLGARILALTHAMNLDHLLVPCNRCHFTISEARNTLEKNGKVAQRIITLLKKEGLEYDPRIRIWHVIDFLHDAVGLDNIRKTVKKPLSSLKLATHPGCQIVRYSDLGRVDDSENPKKLKELVGALGAETIDYAEELDCCGASLLRSHRDSALSLAGSKIKAVQGLVADGLVISCPDCGLMFDSNQKDASATIGGKLNLPVMYYTQLLGLALGIDKKKLGLHINQSPLDDFVVKAMA